MWMTINQCTCLVRLLGYILPTSSVQNEVLLRKFNT